LYGARSVPHRRGPGRRHCLIRQREPSARWQM
jgi:hypothetical protein